MFNFALVPPFCKTEARRPIICSTKTQTAPDPPKGNDLAQRSSAGAVKNSWQRDVIMLSAVRCAKGMDVFLYIQIMQRTFYFIPFFSQSRLQFTSLRPPLSV
jgi:hypothetical protein